jgi:hypothetical protein
MVANVASFTMIPNSVTYSATVARRDSRRFLSEDTPTPESSDTQLPPQSAASYVPGAQTKIPDSDTALSIPSPILLGGSMVLGIAATGMCIDNHVVPREGKSCSNHINHVFSLSSILIPQDPSLNCLEETPRLDLHPQ